MITLTVERAATDYLTISRLLVQVDPKVMAQIGLQVGDLAFLRNGTGRRILTRLGESAAADAGEGKIRMDRFLRQALGVRLNDQVVLEPPEAGDLAPVKRVVLNPSVDVSLAHHLVEHMERTFVGNQTPVSLQAMLYCTFHGSKGGTTYKVVHLDGGPGVVTPETLIEVQEVAAHAPDVEVTYEDVGGLSREIGLLRELIQIPLTLPHVYWQLGIRPPRGVILYGPPGVGKTLIMKAIANEVQARFYYVNGPDIIGTFYGEAESNLRKVFSEAAHHAPSIIFFDEIDALAPKRGETGAHADTRLVSQFLSLLDGLGKVDGVVAIATTNRVDALDPAMRRPGRFDREIYVGPPDARGRREILDIHSREMPLNQAGRDFLPEAAERAHGFVGADLLELCREAGLSALRRQMPARDHLQSMQMDVSGIEVDREDLEDALNRIRPSALREALVIFPNIGWDDIGGLARSKDRLKQLVLRPLERRSTNLGAQGVLLYGPPGTGKTMLAHAVAQAAGVNFIAVDGPEIFSQWLGKSEEAVRHVFRLARQLSPSIIFIDQLDAVVPVRGGGDSTKTADRVVNQLLAEMDGIEAASRVMVIGATNRIDLIDSALLRPGRFGVHLLVPLPDESERLEVLRICLRQRGIQGTSWVGEAARLTEGCSGAELSLLCDEMVRAAARGDGEQAVGVEYSHFRAALENLRQDRN